MRTSTTGKYPKVLHEKWKKKQKYQKQQKDPKFIEDEQIIKNK